MCRVYTKLKVDRFFDVANEVGGDYYGNFEIQIKTSNDWDFADIAYCLSQGLEKLREHRLENTSGKYRLVEILVNEADPLNPDWYDEVS